MVYNHDTVDGCEIRITSWKRWLIPLFPGNHPFGSAGLVGCGHGLMTECGQILRFGSPGFQVWPLWAWRAWLGEWTCPWGAMRGGRNIIIIIIITKVMKVIKVIKIMRGQIWSIHIWYWYLQHLPTSIGCWIAVFFSKRWPVTGAPLRTGWLWGWIPMVHQKHQPLGTAGLCLGPGNLSAIQLHKRAQALQSRWI